MAPQRKSAPYPDPIIVPPSSGNHRQSFIILHGRGSNGEMFGRVLLSTPIPAFTNLREAFPDAKFIFPTASKRRAQLYNRTPINQWFDNWSLHTPTEREELQFDGLRETSEFLHALVQGEVQRVGEGNVVLWGLSQGCAAALVAGLLWPGKEGLGGVMGMCGWLPLRGRMEGVLDFWDGDGGVGPDDVFARAEDGGGGGDVSGIGKVVEYLREELDIAADGDGDVSKLLGIPMFLGHGTKDEKVPLALGREAAGLLRKVNLQVEYKEYEGLGHWYSGEMLRDIVLFIER